MRSRERRLVGAAGLAVLLLLPTLVRADLIKKTIERDTPFTHLAWVIDTRLSPDRADYSSANWDWIAEQRGAAGGAWIIQIRAHHRIGPHPGDAATGGGTLQVIGPYVPGQSAPSQIVEIPHPGLDHTDRLTVGYLAISSSASRLVLNLEHTGGSVRTGLGWPGSGRGTTIVIIVVVASGIGVALWAIRRLAKTQ